MQRAVLVLVVAAALVALALADGKASSVPCGVVFDGAKKADIDLQRSKELIAAHWFDFEDGLERNRVLRYEWAVISEALVTPAIKAGECRTAPGFRGVPDILDWESVGTHTSAKARVSLEDEVTYFVIVRATTSMGRQVYANSDGVTVSQRTSKPVAAADEPIAEPVAASAAKRSVEAAPVYGSGNPLIANGLLLDWNTYCPIDAANRCQQSQKTVGQFLSEQYGPPEFNQNSQSTQVFRTVPPELLVMSSSSSSSRPNGLNFGSIIGIAFGVMGFCVLASCLLILVSSFKSKSDKFKTNINRREEMEEF